MAWATRSSWARSGESAGRGPSPSGSISSVSSQAKSTWERRTSSSKATLSNAPSASKAAATRSASSRYQARTASRSLPNVSLMGSLSRRHRPPFGHFALREGYCRLGRLCNGPLRNHP